MFTTKVAFGLGIFLAAVCVGVVYAGRQMGERTYIPALVYTITQKVDGDPTDIVLENLATGEEILIPRQERSEYDPAWSPDGGRILFASNRFGDFRLFSTGIGGHSRQFGDVEGTQLVWSPDGKSIAFVSDDEEGTDIYIMNVATGEYYNFTGHEAPDYTPSWSPDGTKIAFTSQRAGGLNIFVQDVSTNVVEQITTFGAEQPTWSPDGRFLAFSSSLNEDGPDIFTLELANNNLRNITQHSAPDYNPAWSPDGKLIAFESYRDGNPNIYIMNPDGSNVQAITSGEDKGSAPYWMPRVGGV
jgi:Tol biopolymer transport system component